MEPHAPNSASATPSEVAGMESGGRNGAGVEDSEQALAAGLRILAVRDHSVEELREKLLVRGLSSEGVQQALTRLLDYNYLDDERFAQMLYRSNQHLGRRGLANQMQKRGVPQQIWVPLVNQVDEDEERDRALAAARKHSPTARICSEPTDRWQRRLLSHLSRKGFSASVAYSVCKQLDREQADRGQTSV